MAYQLPETTQANTPKSLFEEAQSLTPENIDPKRMFGLVQAALDPDERKFFKARLGVDSYEMGDYLMPTGRFDRARKDREAIQNAVMKEGLALMDPMRPTQEEAGQYGIAPSPHTQSQLPTRSMQVDRALVPDTFDIDQLQPQGTLGRTEIPGRSPFTGDVENPLRPEIPSIPARPSFYQDPGYQQRTLEFPGGPNPNAPLRPIQQQALNATMEARKHPRVPAAAPAGLQEFDRMAQAEMAAAVEENGGKPLSARQISDVYLRVGKVYSPGARPGSPEYGEATGKAQKAQAEGSLAVPKIQADIEGMRARASHDRSESTSIMSQLEGRLREREAHIKFMGTQASTIGQKAELADATKGLQDAKAGFLLYSKLYDTGKMNRELENKILEFVVSGMTGLATTPKAPGPLESILPPALGGEQQGAGVELVPGSTASPRGSRNPSGQPLAPNVPPVVRNQAEDELKKLEQANPGYEYKRLENGTLKRRKKS